MEEKAIKKSLTFYCANKEKHDDGHPFPFLSTEGKYDDDKLVAICPQCGEPAEERPQHYINLPQMWENASGPKTEEGKRRVRLNAFKTGMHSQVSMIAPAKPGKYPQCNSCPEFEDCKNSYSYCPIVLQPMLNLAKAYEEKDMDSLNIFIGTLQAQTWQTIQIMFASVFETGPLVETVMKRWKEKEGKDNIQVEIVGHQENPVLKHLPKFIELFGGASDQQRMTPRTAAEGSSDFGNEKPRSIDEHAADLVRKFKNVKQITITAQDARGKDEHLKNFKGEDEPDNHEEGEIDIVPDSDHFSH